MYQEKTSAAAESAKQMIFFKMTLFKSNAFQYNSPVLVQPKKKNRVMLSCPYLLYITSLGILSEQASGQPREGADYG